MTQGDYQNINIEPQESSSVKITGDIPFEKLQEHRGAAVKHLGKDMKVDGFRPGNIPEKVIVERVGEMALLSEMAERALRKAYPKILSEHKIDAIGYPQISITKLAEGNPLGFTAEVAVMPDITLPDYKALAKDANAKRESDEVTDEEVEEQVKEILRQKAAYEKLQAKAAASAEDSANQGKKDDNVTELPTPESVAKNKNEGEATTEGSGLPDASGEAYRELTDEFVQTFGQPGQFKDVADFKAKLREHLEVQKKQEGISKHRAKITDAIVEKTEITVPQVMINAELNQMFAQMEEDMKRAQVSMDDYLAHVKKTKEDLRNEWEPLAEKRAKLQLILNEIAEKENIEAPAGEVDHQVAHLLEQYKEADLSGAPSPEDEKRVRLYVESVLKNEKVMQMLENL